MTEVKYKFQIGDIVRFHFDGRKIKLPVVGLRPTGGGMKGIDPLYVIRNEAGWYGWDNIADGDNGMSADGKEIPVHAQFLTLIQRYIPDEDIDVSSLI